MTERETKTVATYFRGSKKFGRTTTLIHTGTGRVLFEGMGEGWTRRELFAAYQKQQATAAALQEDFAAAQFAASAKAER